MEIKQGIFVEFYTDKKTKHLGEIEEVNSKGAYISFPHSPQLNNYYDSITIQDNCVVVDTIPDYNNKIRIVKKQLRTMFNNKYIECCNYLNNTEFRQRNYKAIVNYLANGKGLIEELTLLQKEQEKAKNKAIFEREVRSAPKTGDYIINYISEKIKVVEEQLRRNRNFEAYTNEDIQAKESEYIKLNEQLEELKMFQQRFVELNQALEEPKKPRGRPKKKK